MKLRILFILATLPSVSMTLAGGVSGQTYETPPLVSARAVLGADASGSNYQIEDAAPSDGFLRFYTITTRYGRFEVQGREMLKVRLQELSALAALERMNQSEVFLNAAAKAGLTPISFAGEFVTNPLGTVTQTLSGVGVAFARVASARQDAGGGRDRVGASALGVSSAKRQIAGRLGVDPYTDFKPLAGKLDEIARVTALGNLTVGAAFTAIPGGAGMVISSSRTAQSLGQLVTDKTSTELRAVNRSRLSAMSVPNNIAEAFLNNQVYTPLDQTSIVSSLMQMREVKNRQLFIQRATNATERDLVFFLRRRAELTAEYHNRVESFTEFIDTSGVPINITRSGRIVAIFPLDDLAWTQTTDNAVAAIDRELKRRRLEKDVEIRITGSATASVRRAMHERGWKLVENIER